MAVMKKVTPVFQTQDLMGTIDFYTNVLGFTVDVLNPPEKPTFCILEHGEIRIQFFLPSFFDEEHIQQQEPCLTGQIYIEVENILELYESIKDRVKIEWGPEVYHYGRREFAIKDNNGYNIAFTEPTDDPPDCVE